jgi:RimJ/RimL family protein N-acetyltransferase
MASQLPEQAVFFRITSTHRGLAMSALTPAPVLQSKRLILRSPELRDAEPVIAFLMDENRASGFGHIPKRDDAWRWFGLMVGHWHIRGYGHFVIETKDSHQPAGICGLWNPDGWPEPELAWVVFDGFERKGIAHEAALRVRQWAYKDLGMTTLTSNIVPENTRSIALAERLGAWFERRYDNPNMGDGLLYRHPGPEGV